jgi:hypothetical protein
MVSTSNALAHLSQDDILLGIQRHQAGDWGDVPTGNSAVNERALIEGTRLWSIYRAANGTKFWLITEADRKVTNAGRLLITRAIRQGRSFFIHASSGTFAHLLQISTASYASQWQFFTNK